AHADDILCPGPQAGLDGRDLPTLQQGAEALLGRFHERLVELTALKQVNMLPRHHRQVLPGGLAAAQMPAPQKGRRQQHRQQHRRDDDYWPHILLHSLTWPLPWTTYL